MNDDQVGSHTRPARDQAWWLISNRDGGCHRAPGATAAEAKAHVRAAIAEAFQTEGLSATDARRGASSYQVRIVAGPACYDDVAEAYDAWQGPWDPTEADLAPAIALARRTGHHHVARALARQVGHR
jgi:hypothetical protein